MTTSSPATAYEGDDASLIAGMTRGDRAAMAALYDRYAPLLLAVAARVLGDRTAAEDLLHDALLEAWHRAAEYDPARGGVRAWLVMRVRSRALDRRLAAARRDRLIRQEAPSLDAALRSSVDSGQLMAGDRARLYRQLADLPAELLTVLDLAYFEGLPAAAIGLRLRIPTGTVKSRLARAITLLKRGFQPESGARE